MIIPSFQKGENMEKVIFISKKAKNYFKNNLSYKHLIYDYFDIEVQKILPMLGYKYKHLPELVTSYEKTENEKAEKCFDIDTYVFIPLPEKRNFTKSLCVRYHCD